jgi:hypothetical protein
MTNIARKTRGWPKGVGWVAYLALFDPLLVRFDQSDGFLKLYILRCTLSYTILMKRGMVSICLCMMRIERVCTEKDYAKKSRRGIEGCGCV